MAKPLRTSRRSTPFSLKIVYSAISGVAYLGMGFFLLTAKSLQENLGTTANILGAATLAYGLFRLIGGVIEYRRLKREQEADEA